MLSWPNVTQSSTLLECPPPPPSELLGSFGDNELSPECLDGAQRFLKPDGVSIPQVGPCSCDMQLEWACI